MASGMEGWGDPAKRNGLHLPASLATVRWWHGLGVGLDGCAPLVRRQVIWLKHDGGNLKIVDECCFLVSWGRTASETAVTVAILEIVHMLTPCADMPFFSC